MWWHISGHGLPAGLLLEQPDGSHDLVSSSELVDMLEPAAEHIKLVVTSSCDSAAVTASEQLRLLRIASPLGAAGSVPGARSGEEAVPGRCSRYRHWPRSWCDGWGVRWWRCATQ